MNHMLAPADADEAEAAVVCSTSPFLSMVPEDRSRFGDVLSTGTARSRLEEYVKS